jgi:hypothetical protein
MRTVGISNSDARIIREDHRLIRRGEAGRGSLRRPEEYFDDSVSYKGYFKVVQTDTNKIKIVDGNNSDAEKCGWATVNNTDFEIEAEELIILGNAFIYLEAVYDDVAGTTDDPTLEQSEDYPEYEENKFKCLIATVSYADDAITGIVQQHYGTIIGQTFGECE